MKLKKIVYITPHLSTGGLPQYLLKKIEEIIGKYDVYVIEHTNYSDDFIVQKNKIKSLIFKNHLYTLQSDKTTILSIISKIDPDIIHFEEVPEHFLSDTITHQIYNRKNRKYFIIETSHDSTFDVNNKRFLPDKFMHVSKFLDEKYKKFNVPSEIIEYPVVLRQFDKIKSMKKLGFDPEYKHVLNVGLFTKGKNQGQIFEIARQMTNDKIKFHFVGNMAGNFQDYWEPLLKNKPENCIIHFERDDVEDFYAASDLFLFTSTFELNPLVVKEALSYDLDVVMYNLNTYCGAYDNNPKITFLLQDNNVNVKTIKRILGSEQQSKTYITYATENYIHTAFGLVYSILENSKYPIIVFTVNFNINKIQDNPFIDHDKVKFEQYNNPEIASNGKVFDAKFGTYIDRQDDSVFQILTLRPKILLEAFELGIDEGIFLDADFICRPNIDDLMEHTNKINKFPLLSKGVYDIMLDENRNGDIERPLMDFLGVKERSMFYVVCGIVIFNRNCIDFIKDWYYTCLNPTVIKNWRKWTPFHEETVINVLFWKYKNTQYLPLSYMNIRNKRFVEEFYKFDDTDKSKYHGGMQAFPFYLDGEQVEFTYIPWDKNDVKVFHGLKSLPEIREIIKYEREMNE